MNDPILEIKGLSKTYFNKDKKVSVTVFDSLDLLVESPRVIAVMGESGVGKTTLLNIIGFLDDPSAGSVRYWGIERDSVRDRSKFRNLHVGFVFQNHLLQEEFTALENVSLPLFMRDDDFGKAKERAELILKEVGLGHRLNHKPGELSGGENQRAAIARALVHEPRLILADEPTGNLDFRNQEHINELFVEISSKYEKTVIVATHSEKLAAMCHEVYFFRDGRLERTR